MDTIVMRKVVWNGMNCTEKDANFLNSALKGEVVYVTDNWYMIIGDEKVQKRHEITKLRGEDKITDMEWKYRMSQVV